MPLPSSASVGWIPQFANARTASFRLRVARPVQLLRRTRRAAVTDATGASSYDVVVFQKAYTDAHLELARSLKELGVRLILDVCDNHLFNPLDEPSKAQRAARLIEMLDIVDVVTASTPFMLECLPRQGLVVPDALESVPLVAPYLARRRRAHRSDRSLEIVWFGTAGEPELDWGMIAVADLADHLAELQKRYPDTRVTILSNDRTTYERMSATLPVASRYLRWRTRSYWLHASQCDVVIIPVRRNDFTWAKTANRLTTSYAIGLPAVVSPVPAYQDFADSVLFEDWTDNIARYRADRELAEAHVDTGLKRARLLSSDAAVREAWERAIEMATDQPRT